MKRAREPLFLVTSLVFKKQLSILTISSLVLFLLILPVFCICRIAQQLPINSEDSVLLSKQKRSMFPLGIFFLFCHAFDMNHFIFAVVADHIVKKSNQRNREDTLGRYWIKSRK